MVQCTAVNMSYAEPKRIVPCKFFFKEGYCVKGKYCAFSHDIDSSNPLGRKRASITCKFFMEGGCVYGSSCTFLHPRQKQMKPISKGNLNASCIDSTSDSVLLDKAAEPPVADIDNIWDFQPSNTFSQHCSRDGEYFYGACSTALTCGDGRNPAPKKFAELFDGCNDAIQNKGVKEDYERKACLFYIAGNCRYGSNCRDMHLMVPLPSRVDVDEGKEIYDDDLLQTEIEDAKNAECGICLKKIGNCSLGVRGKLGMLNNCSCTFCLECIRGWRSNLVPANVPTSSSTMIPKSTSHIRLCPLCRRESYFVIPCMRLIKDNTRKQHVIDEYKREISNVACKYFFEYGECPYGSSCFYRHVDATGDCRPEEAPRRIFNESGGELSEFVHPILLASYIPEHVKRFN